MGALGVPGARVDRRVVVREAHRAGGEIQRAGREDVPDPPQLRLRPRRVHDHHARSVLAPLLEALPEKSRPARHELLGRRRQPQPLAVARLQPVVELGRLGLDQGHVPEEAALAPEEVEARVEGVVATREGKAEGCRQAPHPRGQRSGRAHARGRGHRSGAAYNDTGTVP